MDIDKLFTVGQVATRLDERVQRVTYIINREKLKPICRIGIIRMFSEEQVELIKQHLYNLRIVG